MFLKILFLFLLSLGLSSCTTLGEKFTATQPAAKNKSTIYVYRPYAFTGSVRKPDIFVNDQKIGVVPNEAYFSAEVSPGPAKIHMANFIGEKSVAFDVNLNANEIYFLRVDLSLPTLLERHDAKAQKTGEKCAFNGINQMFPVANEVIYAALRTMDIRAQKTSCWPGFQFVNEKFAREELPKTKLSLTR